MEALRKRNFHPLSLISNVHASSCLEPIDTAVPANRVIKLGAAGN